MGNIPAASETDSLILVVGQGEADISLSYHTKDDKGIWTEEFVTAGRYGKNGATGDKKEGDKKTPLGTYRFTMAFGVKENPVSYTHLMLGSGINAQGAKMVLQGIDKYFPTPDRYECIGVDVSTGERFTAKYNDNVSLSARVFKTCLLYTSYSKRTYVRDVRT